eukprot:scaffold2185_cov57-Phaeocystis_antarctica.AAC.2
MTAARRVEDTSGQGAQRLAISQLVERCVPGTFSGAASLDIEAHARRKAVHRITDRHNNTGRWLPLVEAHEVWIADEMVVVCRW